jgi:hypothetical protein
MPACTISLDKQKQPPYTSSIEINALSTKKGSIIPFKKIKDGASLPFNPIAIK